MAPGWPAILGQSFSQNYLPPEYQQLKIYGGVIIIEDTEKADVSPELKTFIDLAGIKAKVVLPIMQEESLWGLLAVHYCQGVRHWLNSEVESLKQIAVQLGIAVQQSTLFQQAKAELAERQKVEEALQTNQRLLQKITDTSPNLLYIYDLKEQRNVYSNPQMSEFLGYSAREIYEMGSNLLPTIIHPDDFPEVVEQAQKFHRGEVQDGEIVESEYRLRNYQGEWCHVLSRVGVFCRTSEGDVKQIIGTATDIRELKETEAALRESSQREQALTLAIQRIRQSLDLETIFVATTEEVRQVINCERVAIYQFDENYRGAFVAESVSKPEFSLIQCLPPLELNMNAHRMEECAVQTLFNAPSTWEDSYLMENLPGDIFKTDITCSMVADIYEQNFSDCYVERLEQFHIRAYIIAPIYCGSRLWGLLATYQCSTPRSWKISDRNTVIQISNQLGVALQQFELLEQTKHQSKALEQAAIAAEAANRAKSEFLANMSHELRTPLNAILGFTQVMSGDSSLSPDHQQQLGIINRAGSHLLNLINDILEMSKIEAGRTILNEIEFDIRMFLKTLQEILNVKALEKGLDLIFIIDETVPAFIRTDEGKLRQVLINILGNALKFTDTGSVTLRVNRGGENLSATSPVILHWEIADTGPGIPADEMGKLFEAFGQTTMGTKVNHGTGLGLPISQKFVQLMGGEITVISEVNQGSLFQFDIQVQVASGHQVPQLVASEKIIGLVPGQPQYRILAVDDRAESRLLLRQILSKLGFAVEEAGNGQEAVEMWSCWRPHLILMDMQMPVMDGFAATEKIKVELGGKDTIIIALTASAFEEDRAMMLAAGCDDFVRKPFQREELLEKISEHLHVEFVYEQPGTPSASVGRGNVPRKASLTEVKECLAQMPLDWVEQVYELASQCIDDKILELLEAVPGEYEPLVTRLSELVNEFQFTEIMELLEDGKTND